MIKPDALNIKEGDFTAIRALYFYYSARNSVLQWIYETLLWPLSPWGIYFKHFRK